MTTAVAHAKPCAHTKYQLTCDEFDRLRDRAGDRCQICDVPGSDTPHGALHIDHDASMGEWAVRGLLCSRCNTQLDSNVHVLDGARVAQYLSQPWYSVWLAGIGLSPEWVSEPPLGVTVKTRNGRRWRRVDSRWAQTSSSGRVLWTASWHALQYRHGPFLRLYEERPVSSEEKTA